MYAQKMAGFGQWLELGTALVGAAGSRSGGGGGGGGAAPGDQTSIGVSTDVATQISPQISPVFIQQSNPTGSPVNAGTAMSPPGSIPITGALPGFDYASGSPSYQIPRVQTAGFGGVTPLMAAGLLGLMGFAIVLGQRKRKRKGRR